MQNNHKGYIGVFDSGYGGLTILKEFQKRLPQYDYIYLGDNARAPYGTRSFEVVYQYTLECVEFLFAQGCEIIILACNTASAQALRTIQQKVLPIKYPGKKVLGVLRPSTEMVGELSKTKVVGVLATTGTVKSESYKIEIEKFTPGVKVVQQACPLWVPIIEANQHTTKEGEAIFKKDIDVFLEAHPKVDTIVLGCTHYPLIYNYLRSIIPAHIQLVTQGEIVAERLEDYLNRHTEISTRLNRGTTLQFYSSENSEDFKSYLKENDWGDQKVNHFTL
ncbi:glutamate racemase [Lishizhenia tianjinensis]|uniref:Glutamate racemase n=1 Tax=Lishizhenia tianjinensis TaxID=477690 RepID=A0A1I7A2Y9_9FLAO|nr:glutamate racemase [Lishizhenia tianjinensis]SFT69271.1 glutamate racemase [Lishizhenia tianjinensis]